jgi:hypothetical protein
VSLEQVLPALPKVWTLEGLSQGTKIRQSLYKLGADAMKTVLSKQVQGGGWQELPPVAYKRL